MRLGSRMDGQRLNSLILAHRDFPKACGWRLWAWSLSPVKNLQLMTFKSERLSFCSVSDERWYASEFKAFWGFCWWMIRVVDEIRNSKSIEHANQKRTPRKPSLSCQHWRMLEDVIQFDFKACNLNILCFLAPDPDVVGEATTYVICMALCRVAHRVNTRGDHRKRLHTIPTERYDSVDLKISTMADLWWRQSAWSKSV